MLRKLMNKWIDRVERRLGVPADEARYVANHSPRALWAWRNVGQWAEYRRRLPADAYYVAKTAAYTVEDCGSCLQIAVNQARDHLSPELLRNVLGGRAERLSPDLQAVYRFAQLQADRIDDEELRERLIRTYGEEAFIELATAIASTRVFPTFKRALGFAKSCSLVHVNV
jgi:hypothetical protein